MPMDKFKNYFVKTIYGVHKVIGKDGSNKVSGAEYIIARDVQDAFHAYEYDYVSHILDIIVIPQNWLIAMIPILVYSKVLFR